jgi:DNA-3-methyladenine glycosylase II
MAHSARVTLVPVRAPFRLDLTANVLRRLSSNVVDVFDGTTYRRLIGEPHRPVLLEVRQDGPAALAASLSGAGAERYDAAMLVERLLGTAADLRAFTRAAATVSWLAPLAAGALGVKPPRYPTLWETCVNAIVYQQVSIHAAGAILRRVIERYAEPQTVAGERIYPFPGAATLVEADADELRGLGLSINKVVALRRVGRAILDGDLDEAGLAALPTPELAAALVAHRGIGPWTAAVIALRGFGRLDTFPMNDSGVAKSIRDLTGQAEVDVDALLAILGPQRGMLYYHLLLGRLASRGDVELAATRSGS